MRRSRPTCSRGSSAPTSASAPASSARPPESSRPTTPTPSAPPPRTQTSRRAPLPLPNKAHPHGYRGPRTPEAISLALGEYDRDTVSQTLGRSEPQEWLAHSTHSDSVSYQTQRQRILTPGEIARLPDEHALLLRGADWNTIRLTPWHETQPWERIGGAYKRRGGSTQDPPPAINIYTSRQSQFRLGPITR
jgi:hypothetical protein